MMKRSLYSAAALCTLALATPVRADPIPDPTDRQWLSVGSGYCYANAPNGTPTCPGGGTATGSIDPATEFTDPYWKQYGVYIGGGGSTSANTLRVFVRANSGFSRTTAVIRDTYVLLGPAGTVDIGAAFTADGSVDILDTGVPGVGFAGQAYATIAIGTGMSTGGTSVVGYLAGDVYETGFVNSPAHFEFDLATSVTKTVTVGTAFDLAFVFQVHGSIAYQADGLSTGLIDFTLPDGYTLTSTLGWTSPTATTTVPAPASVAILAVGLVGLRIMRPRRRPI